MGSYGVSAEEIADKLEEVDFQAELQGDFYEEDFIQGAKDYLNILRKQGAFIYSSLADGKKQMCKECGRIKPTSRHKCPNSCKPSQKTGSEVKEKC